jgi:hypothetical protein
MMVDSCEDGQVSRVPRIEPVPAGVKRPLWSVMIPTFNCARYLRQTLESVLAQDPGVENMQIEVVDDVSMRDDPETVVQDVGRGRIQFYRKAGNEGPVANFNTCIERSTGELVQILHGDDLVCAGYYNAIRELTKHYPELGIYATRCFFVDEESVILGVSGRVPTLEKPGKSPEPFFYYTPIQFSGTTVRRSSYEALGGFRSDLVHTADCEMWARIVATHGGMVSSDVKASYRMFAATDTGRLAKTAENVRDICRLNAIFSERYSGFSAQLGRNYASEKAWQQYLKFKLAGEQQAAVDNYRLWAELTPVRMRVLAHLKSRGLPWLRRFAAALGA